MGSVLPRLCLYLLGVTVVLNSGVLCDFTAKCGAYLRGDIVIGILGSVHSTVEDLEDRLRPETYTCSHFDLIPFVESLAVIHTIETINNSSLLPGVKLGYLMCDPCVYGTKALDCVENMLAVNRLSSCPSDYSDFRSPVKAFIGERYSELSIPVARLLSLYMIPQISCTSSSPALSDKLRYAAFFRVVPSDVHQMKALVQIVDHFSWKWVGVVTLDDDYGKAALEGFLHNAKEQSICVHFKEILPNYLGQKDMGFYIRKVAEVIRKSNSTVVVLFLRPELVEMLFEEMIKTNTSRVWIASDFWSVTRFIMEMKDINKVGDVFGLTFVTGKIPGFEDFLKNLRPSPESMNDFIREYKQMRFNCTSGQQSEHTSPLACTITNPQDANDDYLLQRVDLTEVYNQRLAVYAIAHAIKELLKCNNTACSEDTNFPPWKLLSILRKVNFTVDTRTHSFNKFGDFENGYNFIMWKEKGDRRTPEVVGKYLIQSGKMEVYKDKIEWFNQTEPTSRCSNPCPAGTHKQISQNEICCYTCANCSEGTVSEEPDQAECHPCKPGYSSIDPFQQCQKLTEGFLEWSDPHSVVVMVGTVLGILLLIFLLIFFTLHRHNPIISMNYWLSCFMTLGLLSSFISVITFLGNPSDDHCRAQQILYGLGYTLCVSCILVRAFRSFLTVLAYNPNREHFLSRFNKPFIIMAFLTGVQAFICTLWFIFGSPHVEEMRSSIQVLTTNRLCMQGSMIGFGFMHVYIAVLAVVCFLIAFKGRDEETESIVFSMLIHLFVWMCFIPLFITQTEQRAIVQISAIMVSNYGVVFCHLLPKWYEIISEQVERSNVASGVGLQHTRSSSGSEASIQTPRASSQAQLVTANTDS